MRSGYVFFSISHLSMKKSFSPTTDKFELPGREPANLGLTAMSQQSIASKTKDSKEPKQLCLKIRGCDTALKYVIFKLSWKIIDEGSCHPPHPEVDGRAILFSVENQIYPRDPNALPSVSSSQNKWLPCLNLFS